MPSERRKILVTSALPYANGDIHIGHLFEDIQADIWVRFQRLSGNEIHFVCADDAHGTPVMLRAAADGVPPEELIGRMREEHVRDYAAFGISFDNYHSTHSEENRALAEEIYGRLRDAGLVEVREVEQLFDPEEGIFLPDRYVRGQCPRCGAQDQYGDSCESCGAAYSTRELVGPRSAISGATPVWRKSDHHFLRLGEQGGMLREWIGSELPDPAGRGASLPRLQGEVRNKLDEWFRDGLRDWDISRDGPYFGFRIPGTEDKYFYVWLDAPIGYMASFRNLCDREGIDFDRFWRDGDGTELYHFIGKDILYFHALFWPAMLHNSGFRKPTRLFAHGFLMVDGEKMSKSRGTFITARSWIEQGLNPEWLRYYFAGKLNDRIEDANLGLDDFVNRVNSDLVGKLVNIPSRVAGFLAKHFAGELCAPDERWIEPDAARLGGLYEDRRFSELVFEVMRLAETVNARIEQARPWDLAKGEAGLPELRRVCSCALESFRVLCVLLKPILPSFAAAAEEFLRTGPLAWDDIGAPLAAGHRIGRYPHLMRRVDRKTINRLLEANRAPDAAAAAPKAGKAQPEPKGQDTPKPIGIGEFAKVDMRVAEVLEAHEVDGSDRLLRLVLDVGDARKTVFAGIKGHHAPGDLVGRQVVVVNNLAPRKMRFGTSEGMVLTAGDDDEVRLLAPTGKCPNGSRIS